MKLEPLIQTPNAWTGIADRFAVHLFQGRITVGAMDQLEAFGIGWFRRNPGKTVTMAVVFPSKTRMTHDERVRMAKLMKSWQDQRVASAITVLSQGMIGAVQRSVLTGLMILAPPPHPAKVFGDIADAVAWIAPHVLSLCGPQATKAAIASAVDAFCSEFEARERSAG